MLGVEFFNNDIIRKYTTVFGTLFNDIYIHKFSANGTKLQVIPVPIQLASASKNVVLDEKNPITTKLQTQLPRMAYQLTGLSLDRAKLKNPIHKNVRIENPELMKTQFVGIPYTLEFELIIYTKTADDAHQIIGQIVPFFTPDFTPTINVIPDMALKIDSKIELTSITPNDDFEGSTDEPRIIQWTLNFTMDSIFFGPLTKQGVIKRAIVDLIPVPGSGDVVSGDIDMFNKKVRVTVTPGLTSTGEPTTDPTKTIPYKQIEQDDPYGIITQIEVFE